MATKPLKQNPSRCYVYEIIVDGVVRYIGKGTRRRAQSHISIAKDVNRRRGAGEVVKTQKFYNRLAKALRSGSDVSHRIVVSDLSTIEAFEGEIAAISAAPDGQLWNEQPGGQGADSGHFKRLWRDPECRARYMAVMTSPEAVERRKALAAIQWSDQAARERNRKKVKEQWTDSIFRSQRIASLRRSDTPERRKRISEKIKAKWADPEFRDRQEAAIRRACSGEVFRAKLSANSKAMWAVPGAKEKYGPRISEGQMASEKFKTVWNDPAHREKMRLARIKGWETRRVKCST